MVVTAGRVLMWASVPWCVFLFYTAWTSDGSTTFLQAIVAMLMFGWVPWIAGRALVMIGQHLRRRT